MSEHTKERLRVIAWREHSMSTLVCEPARADGISTETVVAQCEGQGVAKREADARRLVACWNACEGISTENLERATASGDLAVFGQDVMRDRDELIEFVRTYIAARDSGIAPNLIVDENSPLTDAARDLLAKHAPNA